MTLSPSLVNALLIAGMVVDLLLIALVVRAMLPRRAERVVARQPADAVERDLEQRLDNLSESSTMAASSPLTARIAPLISPPPRSQPVPRVERPSQMARSDERTTAGALPPSTRLALPESGRLTTSPGTVLHPTTGLDPVAARFTSADRDPGVGAAEPARSPAIAQPALPPSTRLNPDRLQTEPIPQPAPLEQQGPSSRFTEVAPAATKQERTHADAPQTHGLSMPTERLSGRVSGPGATSRTSSGASGTGELGSLLRGESTTLVGAAPGFQPAVSPILPATPPQVPENQDRDTSPQLQVPAGAVVFTATRLRVQNPAAIAARTDVPREEPWPDASPFAQDLPAGSGSFSGLTSVAGLQSAQFVGDFDLPDAGFETHVFSTAELIDEGPFATTLGSVPSLGESGEPQLSETQQQAVQVALDEIASVAEVTGAYVLGSSGTTLAATSDTPLPSGVLGALDALLQAAIMEGKRLDLGECGSVAVELPESALLLSPVADRVGLVVSVVDPSRLMPVRRLLRKPLASLRAAYAAHDVS